MKQQVEAGKPSGTETVNRHRSRLINDSDPRSDYDLVVQKDHQAMWMRYERYCLWRVRRVKWTFEDESHRTAEAYLLFRKRWEDMDLAKVKDPKTFCFAHMLYFAFKNFRKRRARDYAVWRQNISSKGYDENASFATNRAAALIANRITDENFVYSPEPMLTQRKIGTIDAAHTKAFNSQLTEFERRVLKLRREGFTYRQISVKTGWSVSYLKSHVRKLKVVAAKIFEVAYN